jgi:hypothetical protein
MRHRSFQSFNDDSAPFPVFQIEASEEVIGHELFSSWTSSPLMPILVFAVDVDEEALSTPGALNLKKRE